MRVMRTFYLDLCCLNRPFDEQHQPRVRLETEAVLGLIQLSILGELWWVTSDALELESSQNPDTDRRGEVDLLLRTATTRVAVGLQERQRGRDLPIRVVQHTLPSGSVAGGFQGSVCIDFPSTARSNSTESSLSIALLTRLHATLATADASMCSSYIAATMRQLSTAVA